MKATSQSREPARDPRTETRVAAELAGGQLGHPCVAFTRVSSTMDVAHQLAGEGADEGLLIVAAEQTAGRGRAGRSWMSPPGGLYLSLVLRPQRDPAEWPQLALVAGLAAAQSVPKLSKKQKPTIRWPNDVLVDGRKLAGILTEAKVDAHGNRYVVVGLGMNLTTRAEDLPDVATSLTQLLDEPPAIWQMAARFVTRFERAYCDWHADTFAAIRSELLPWISLFGQVVQITTPTDTFEAQATDLDEQGRLLVRLDSGIIRPVDVGDVTLLR